MRGEKNNYASTEQQGHNFYFSKSYLSLPLTVFDLVNSLKEHLTVSSCRLTTTIPDGRCSELIKMLEMLIRVAFIYYCAPTAFELLQASDFALEYASHAAHKVSHLQEEVAGTVCSL